MIRKKGLFTCLLILLCMRLSAAVEFTGSEVMMLGKTAVLKMEFSGSCPVYKTISSGEFIQIDLLDCDFAGEKTYPVYKQNLKLYRVTPLKDDRILRIKVVAFRETVPVIEENGNALTVKIPDSDEKISEPSAEIDAEAVSGKYYLRALELIKVKEWERALHYLEEAKKKTPENARINEAYDLCMNRLNRFQNIQEDFKAAQAFYDSGNYEKACEKLEILANNNTDFLEARELLMKSHFKLRNYESAVSEGNRIIEMNPAYDNRDDIIEMIKKAEEFQKMKWGINRLTFNCSEEPIEDVLYALSKETGLKFNYLGAKNLRVSLALENATLDELMSKLFKKNSLEYEIKDGVVRVSNASLPDDMVKNVKFFLPLGSTLKALANLMNLNIIINPEVDEETQVNISIENNSISKQELFDLILKNYNLVRVEYNKNTCFVVPRLLASKYQYQDRKFHTFRFSNIEPTEFLAIIKSMKELNDRLDFSNLVVADLDENSNVIATRPTMTYHTKYTKEDLQLIADIKERLSKISDIQTVPGAAAKAGEADSLNPAVDAITKEEKEVEKRKVEELIKLEAEQHNQSVMVDPLIPNPDGSINLMATQKNTKAGNSRFIREYEKFGKYSDDEDSKTMLPKRKVKALLVFETDENIQMLEKLVKDFDVKRPQVMIAVKIIDINRSVNEKLGLFPSFDGSSSSIDVKKLGKMSKIQLDATLEFLEQHLHLKTLANPNVRVLDGEKAVVETGVQKNKKTVELRTIKENVSSTNTTNTQTVTADKLVNIWNNELTHTGVILNLVPFIHQNDEVSIMINVVQTELVKDVSIDKISAYVAYPPQSANDRIDDYPSVVDIRRFDTNIRMKHGETVVLGGFISQNNSDLTDKTPFINKLPVIGNLFSRKTNTDTRKEMVLLITPFIVNQDFAETVVNAEGEVNSAEYQAYMKDLKRKLR